MRKSFANTPELRSWFAAMLATAATYIYFLIFAEFAFLQLAQAVVPAPDRMRWLMLALGGGGVTGAVLGARVFTVSRQRTLLAWAFRACAVSALAALFAQTFLSLWLAGAAIGLSLGWLTVTLTAGLRSAAGGKRLGLCIGTGTGLAYAACNVPGFFQASAAVQTLAAAAIAVAASLLPRIMTRNLEPVSALHGYKPRSVMRWVVILLALVWMDSAAFYIVQHTTALRDVTWGDPIGLLTNALTHLLAAIAAGYLLDRGWRDALAGMAIAALAVACLMLNGTLSGGVSAVWFYTAGVSLYSTVLVEYPARSGRPWIAAVVFAVAGWCGSALGIGMAQDLEQVPVAFVVAAVTTTLAFLMARTRALTSGATLAGALILMRPDARAENNEATPTVTHGREVYIAEGCIHCHSQYLRPRVVREAQAWGPVIPLNEALAARPPLFGTRRQGPDLSQVGNRRTAEWNRLHLIAPQTVSPGSRMPSYAHLFTGNETRGKALLAYLSSLGANTATARQAQITSWIPDWQDALPASDARALFRQLCSPCHGVAGRGDGPLAGKLSQQPPDWTQSPWRYLGGNEDRELKLSRIIKFGLPGLPMAGHEYLPDAEIVGLARFVQTLHKE